MLMQSLYMHKSSLFLFHCFTLNECQLCASFVMAHVLVVLFRVQISADGYVVNRIDI